MSAGIFGGRKLLLVGGFVLTGAGLAGQLQVHFRDTENRDLGQSPEHSLVISNPNPPSEPITTYDGSSEAYLFGNSATLSKAGSSISYGTSAGAPTRSPWTATAGSSGNTITFAVAGQTSRSFHYGYARQVDGEEPTSWGGKNTVEYHLEVSLSQALDTLTHQGRTGVAGKLVSVTGSLNFSTEIQGDSSHQAVSSIQFGEGFARSVPEAQQQIFFTPQNANSGSISLSGDRNDEVGYYNGTPVVSIGAIEFWLRGGEAAFTGITGDFLSFSTQIAKLTLSGTLNFNFQEANLAGEFIYRGESGHSFLDASQWSQQMSPGVADRMQFTHTDSRTITLDPLDRVTEDNRSLRIANAGTTTMDLGNLDDDPSLWRVGRNFAAIADRAVVIESGKLIVTDGRMEIHGDMQLGVVASDVATFEVSARGDVSFRNRERVISPEETELVSTWLTVGSVGQGTVNVRNGGKFTAENVRLATTAGSVAKIEVSGNGSEFAASAVFVGGQGTGELVVRAGGSAVLGLFEVGAEAGSQGSIRVEGAGSRLFMETGSVIGKNGLGRVEVLDGGTLVGGIVSNGDLDSAVLLGVGQSGATGTSTLLVSGAGSTITNVGLIVNQNGLFQLRDGAVMKADGAVNVVGVAGGRATFQNIGSASISGLDVRGIVREGVIAATGQMDVFSNAAVDVDQGMIGVGGRLNVSGTGAKFTVDQMLIDGTMDVSNGGQVNSTGMIVVNPGGSITGSGGVIAFEWDAAANDLVPYLQVKQGGSARPGNSPGTLTINGNVVFDAGSTLQLEIGGVAPGSLYDQLVVSGNATFAAGALVEFAFINGFAPTIGQTFDFFDIGGTFEFASDPSFLAFTGLEEGWDYETSLIDGGFRLTSLSNGSTTTTASAIPEPSTWALIVGGAAFALVMVRRRFPSARGN
ncbi:PEP-CTERM sorting domain-containing protein [Oleiharenicola lentus]|uniref:PEP-CTERM sorting domain-containing protein n=1 Tax=Oleiharenicola lentus TaxID=2508720 RepID=UPI003F66929B